MSGSEELVSLPAGRLACWLPAEGCVLARGTVTPAGGPAAELRILSGVGDGGRASGSPRCGCVRVRVPSLLFSDFRGLSYRWARCAQWVKQFSLLLQVNKYISNHSGTQWPLPLLSIDLGVSWSG